MRNMTLSVNIFEKNTVHIIMDTEILNIWWVPV